MYFHKKIEKKMTMTSSDVVLAFSCIFCIIYLNKMLNIYGFSWFASECKMINTDGKEFKLANQLISNNWASHRNFCHKKIGIAYSSHVVHVIELLHAFSMIYLHIMVASHFLPLSCICISVSGNHALTISTCICTHTCSILVIIMHLIVISFWTM